MNAVNELMSLIGVVSLGILIVVIAIFLSGYIIMSVETFYHFIMNKFFNK